MKLRTYSDLCNIDSFIERFRYLKLAGEVGVETFGWDRYLNQYFYKTPEWKRIRRDVILRDSGLDLGVEGHEISGRIIVHHMNPITERDIYQRSDLLLDPEYLICVSHGTHNAITYGNEELLILDPIIRVPNDTCPWK